MSTSHDFLAGEVLTAALMDSLPQGVLGIGTATADSSSTSGTTTLDLVTASAVTIAATGRRLRITGTWRSITGTVSGDVFSFRIQEGATVLDEQNQQIEVASVGHNGGVIQADVASPTAASHTYKLTVTRVLGTGTASVAGAATYKMKILVEDVGQV